MDHLFVLVRHFLGEVAPAREIVGEEVLTVGVDDLRVAGAEKGEGSPHGADVDRLPQAVQHKHLAVEYVNHRVSPRVEAAEIIGLTGSCQPTRQLPLWSVGFSIRIEGARMRWNAA